MHIAALLMRAHTIAPPVIVLLQSFIRYGVQFVSCDEHEDSHTNINRAARQLVAFHIGVELVVEFKAYAALYYLYATLTYIVIPQWILTASAVRKHEHKVAMADWRHIGRATFQNLPYHVIQVCFVRNPYRLRVATAILGCKVLSQIRFNGYR